MQSQIAQRVLRIRHSQLTPKILSQGDGYDTLTVARRPTRFAKSGLQRAGEFLKDVAFVGQTYLPT